MAFNHLWVIVLALLAPIVSAAWDVSDGKLTIRAAGHRTSSSSAESISFDQLGSAGLLGLPHSKSLEISFKSLKNGKPLIAHQTMIQLRDPSRPGMDYLFAPTTAKLTTGAVKISIPHSQVPSAFHDPSRPLELSLLLSSPDDEAPLKRLLTPSLIIEDGASPAVSPPRMTVSPELSHTFRPPPRTVSKVVALVFQVGAVLLTVFTILCWHAQVSLGSAKTAFSKAPVAHLSFLASLVAIEGTFVLYFLGQSIFDTLFYMAILGPMVILSGSRALREVAQRRLSGETK